MTIDGGNLIKVLMMFAAWRRCRSCGARVLHVNEDVRTDGDFTCGSCEERQDLIRVLLFLRPANDNARWISISNVCETRGPHARRTKGGATMESDEWDDDLARTVAKIAEVVGGSPYEKVTEWVYFDGLPGFGDDPCSMARCLGESRVDLEIRVTTSEACVLLARLRELRGVK